MRRLKQGIKSHKGNLTTSITVSPSVSWNHLHRIYLQDLFMPSNINTAKTHKATKFVVMSNFVGKVYCTPVVFQFSVSTI